MELGKSLERVCAEYLAATRQKFSQHDLAKFIRNECRKSIEQIVNDGDRFIVKGSAGQGTWARGPWIGIFDRLVTTGAQSGFYPVYLFREDMGGVYLSLNLAMTEAKKLYKADAKEALQARAANYRAMLGSDLRGFSAAKINLAPSTDGNDTAYYEKGNICAKFYPANEIPDEAVLLRDLSRMLDLYGQLIAASTAADTLQSEEGDEPTGLDFEDASRIRFHKRIERNLSLIKKVKSCLGHTCQICRINFEERYGSIGKDFIEAHHLIPISSLNGRKVALDPCKDFAVLCANCHRMIHRSGFVGDLEKFKKHHFHG